MALSNLARTWTKRVKAYQAGAPIEKSKIGAICRIMRGGDKSIPDDIYPVLELITEGQVAWRITPEQTEQGLNWLKRPVVRKALTPTQQSIINDFSHYLFAGTFEIQTAHGRVESTPIYRVCAHGPACFDYTARCGLSGSCELFEIFKTRN